MLLLQKYEPESKTFSGDTLTCLVTYVLTGGQFGVEQGFCVMSIKVTDSVTLTKKDVEYLRKQAARAQRKALKTGRITVQGRRTIERFYTAKSFAAKRQEGEDGRD